MMLKRVALSDGPRKREIGADINLLGMHVRRTRGGTKRMSYLRCTASNILEF